MTGCTVFVKANAFCWFLPHLHSEHKPVKAPDVTPPTVYQMPLCFFFCVFFLFPTTPLSCEGSDGMRCWLNHLWVERALQPRGGRDGWLDEIRAVLMEGSKLPRLGGPKFFFLSPPPCSSSLVLIAVSVMICLRRRTRSRISI